MKQSECMAIILAGGNETRHGALTHDIEKPMVQLGGKYRIIDFTLSNCTHSGIFPLGILTQYRALELHKYIGNGTTWSREDEYCVDLLPSTTTSPYTGTAHAVYQNLSYVEQFQPEHVLVLPSDHIYKMDYSKLLEFHKKLDADATISVTSASPENASRFGSVNITDTVKITAFSKKLKKQKNAFASVGIYLFKWSKLKKCLIDDEHNANSKHDFGKDIIPALLSSGKEVYAYPFDGYWQDVSIKVS